MSQVPLDRSFALHVCLVPSPTRVTFNPDPGPTDSTNNITDHGSNDSHFTPRTSGALEVASCGLCRSPARLIAHPCPQSARHLSLGAKLPARLSTLTPDTTSPGGHRNAAHPDEDERPPGRSPYTKRRYVSPCHTLLLSPCPLPTIALRAIPYAPKYSSSDCHAMMTAAAGTVTQW